MTDSKKVHVVGGGLAGSEATWQLAKAGIPVILHEMRPVRETEAHITANLAELVCSNSFRSDDHEANAVGVLHEEMRRMGSIIMSSADANSVPAGGALAVDRHGYSAAVEKSLEDHPLIEIQREEITSLDQLGDGLSIIASGPLTAPDLSKQIQGLADEDSLAFFDAIAPILHKDSIDFDKVWYQSRYDKGDGQDYINCPLDEEQYNAFIDALIEGDKTEFKDWEKDTPYFEGCLPIEVMAERGRETLRFGPMKPVGLTNPHNPTVKAHAIIQLRQDNALGTLYNLVGFQTKLKYGPQVEIFRTIPGLENAEFARLGGIHRNTFMNSPRLLDKTLRHKSKPNLRFAGQMTGVEGYIESAACGLLAATFTIAELEGREIAAPPITTAMGALLNHITEEANAETFQPMNVNFGLMPPPPIQKTVHGKNRKLKGRDRKAWMAARCLEDHAAWLAALDQSSHD
ncbi:methylenetetrahydrofolate--tRNA-(uracil(54)-C(5))-methyltransferase (FADH(2)-oxidizing) TrmFO [Alphaproteobacteria bacterium]|nr:methylenetetrahydrofolate--tRNA-(uracil(54)-C(5))-methyltransferase (FADH(2)-oxidizing) TrmFO [Alphaproteobacteria bacterium]